MQRIKQTTEIQAKEKESRKTTQFLSQVYSLSIGFLLTGWTRVSECSLFNATFTLNKKFIDNLWYPLNKNDINPTIRIIISTLCPGGDRLFLFCFLNSTTRVKYLKFWNFISNNWIHPKHCRDVDILNFLGKFKWTWKKSSDHWKKIKI